MRRGSVKSVAVIGGRADYGMISGGGSAQVDAPGDPDAGQVAAQGLVPDVAAAGAMEAKAPEAKVTFSSGENVEEAVAAAKAAEVAVVFAWQWESEGERLGELVAALWAGQADRGGGGGESADGGGARDRDCGERCRGWNRWERWSRPGIRGSKGADDAIANVLFGDVNPSGKLPMTFPVSEADLPHPVLEEADARGEAGAELQRGLQRGSKGWVQVV